MGCAASAIKNIDILETLNQGTEDQADVVEVHYFGIYGRASPLMFLCHYVGIHVKYVPIDFIWWFTGGKKAYGALPVI